MTSTALSVDPPEVRAILVLDVARGTVLHQNADAARLSGDLPVPVDAGAWATAAGLHRVRDDAPVDLLTAGAAVGRELVRSATDGGTWLLSGSGSAGTGERLAVVLLDPVVSTTEAVAPDSLERRAAMASDLSFTIADARLPDMPLVWVNPAFTTTTGYTSDDVLGSNCRFLQGPATDRDAVDRVRLGLAERKTVGETLLNYRKDGRPFWNQLVISPVSDPDGTVTHFVGVQADVTERVEVNRTRQRQLDEATAANLRLSTLARVSEELGEILETDELLRRAAAVVAAEFGCWSALVTYDGRRARTDVATTDPHLAWAAERLSATSGWADESLAVLDIRAGGSRFSAPFAITPDLVSEHADGAELDAMHALGLGSAMSVGLRARGQVVGVLAVISPDVDAFGPDDAATFGDLGHRVGLLLDNVRLYARERDAARTLQERMLPRSRPVAGLDVAFTYRPAGDGVRSSASIGGDWFDVLEHGDGSVSLTVGDVVGHDLHAAAAMGQLRSVLLTVASEEADPAAVVGRVDQLVERYDLGDMATCVYGVLGAAAADGVRTFAYCRAGHPSPLLRRPDGAVEPLDGALTTPFGVVVPGPFETARTDLAPGSLLVLYTDGLIESRHRSQRAGIAELTTALAAAPADLDAAGMRDHLLERLASGVQDDDLCLLVVRTGPATA